MSFWRGQEELLALALLAAMKDAKSSSYSDSGEQTLYHQTDCAGADAIVSSQTMLPGGPSGAVGMAGRGIYFAETPGDTHRKARHHGPILKAKVATGRQLVISPSGDRSITYDSLRRSGYDSVQIPRPGGTEHVVYDSSQVRDIEYHSGGSSCSGGYSYSVPM